MNQQQRKYALERVNEIYTRKLNQIKEDHTKPSKCISEKERIDLIKSGKVKLKKGITAAKSYSNICDVFDFSKYSYGPRTDDSKVEKKAIPLKQKRDKIKDEIMLGDAEVALKLIAEFSK